MAFIFPPDRPKSIPEEMPMEASKKSEETSNGSIEKEEAPVLGLKNIINDGTGDKEDGELGDNKSD